MSVHWAHYSQVCSLDALDQVRHVQARQNCSASACPYVSCYRLFQFGDLAQDSALQLAAVTVGVIVVCHAPIPSLIHMYTYDSARPEVQHYHRGVTACPRRCADPGNY